MSFASEFKEFAVKGNVIDMAVGIIIGVAFGKIVASFVADILMPPIGLALGGVDFTNLAVVLKAATADTPAVLLAWGKFVQTIVDFVIIAMAVFVGVKAMNSLNRKEEVAPAKPAAPPKQEVLLEEIRDLLKTKPMQTDSTL